MSKVKSGDAVWLSLLLQCSEASGVYDERDGVTAQSERYFFHLGMKFHTRGSILPWLVLRSISGVILRANRSRMCTPES